MTRPDNHLVGRLVVARAGALGRLAPRGNRMTAARGPAFTTAVRVVDRILRDTAGQRALAQPAVTTGLGEIGVGIVRVRHGADGAHAVRTNVALLARGQADHHHAAIAADELGVDIDEVLVLHGDTSIVPYGIGTFGSRATAVGGTALYFALQEIKAKAKKFGAMMLDSEDVTFEGGICTCTKTGKSVTIKEIAGHFGSQVLVLSVDARRSRIGYEVTTHGGRNGTGINALEWIERACELGVGEILLNSMDADGTRAGYDIGMITDVRPICSVPLIASGGAGNLEDFAHALDAGANALLAASVFHFGTYRIKDVKRFLSQQGYLVRETSGA